MTRSVQPGTIGRGVCLQWRQILVLLLMLISAFAGAAPSERDVLQMPQACLQYADFQQARTLEGLPKPLISSGHILLDCQRGTLWNTVTPIRETLVYTFAGKHWLIKANGETQAINNAAQKRIGDILARIVRGDQAFLEKLFQQEIVGATTRLVPAQRRLKKYIERIDLTPTADGLEVVVQRTDQNHMTLQISAVRELADLTFATCVNLTASAAGCSRLLAEAGD